MFRPQKQDIKIYTAGKTWAAHWFRELKGDYNINARWIDFQDVLSGPDDEFSQEIHNDEAYKQAVWDDGCKVDCLTCDMGILACAPIDGEMQSGALVELGHITAFDKPMYILGTCASVEPAGHSDRAWKSQKCVYYWPDIDVQNPDELRAGFHDATVHYQAYYSTQWIKRRAQTVADEVSAVV